MIVLLLPLLFNRHHHHPLRHLPLPSMISFFNVILVLIISPFLGYQFFFLVLCSSIFDFQCKTCELSKQCCASFSPSSNRVLLIFPLFIMMCGDMLQLPLIGFRYFVTFVDDYSRATWVYFLKSKSGAFLIFQCFTNWSKLSLILSSRFFVWIIEGNIYLMFFPFISLLMTSFIKLLVLVLLNKMALVNERIAIFLRLCMLYSFKCMFRKGLGWYPLDYCLLDGSYALSHSEI